jgi:hypothetical protein
MQDDHCHYCGYPDGPPLPPQTDPTTGSTLNDAYAPDFAGYNLTAVAELCADPNLYTGARRAHSFFPRLLV